MSSVKMKPSGRRRSIPETSSPSGDNAAVQGVDTTKKATNLERSALSRFGGATKIDWCWPQTSVGEVVTSAGPGWGYSMVPWALDRYERVLRLDSVSSLLLRRLIKHSWEYGKPANPSLHRIAQESMSGRSTVQKHILKLCDLNLIQLVSAHRGADYRREYDVSPTYSALALCEMTNPRSKWASERGQPLSLEEVRGHWMENFPGINGTRLRFNLDLGALQKLIWNSEWMEDDE